MQPLEYIRLIWEYNYWANHKLLNCLQTISEQQFKQHFDYGIGSLHVHVIHIMWAEALWLRRIKGQDRINWTAESHPTLDVIFAQWQSVENDYRDYLKVLTQDELMRNVPVYSMAKDKHYIHPVYEILIHVVNHGSDHRAQMLRLIGDFGGETFEQDMIFYFRELRESE